ncbi:MAG: hypothetical protein HQK49_18135 [Oligoflexia bacterium]|nr:hypothetical protein [Oligoflexia bacterium]
MSLLKKNLLLVVIIIGHLIISSAAYSANEKKNKENYKNGSFKTVVDNYCDDSNVFVGHYPLGFNSVTDFKTFMEKLISMLPTKATFLFQGSSVAGESYQQKGNEGDSKAFDKGRISDYDIGIISDKIFNWAQEKKVKIKNDNHTIPLKGIDLSKTNLQNLSITASKIVKKYSTLDREVNFIVYKDRDSAIKHTGPSLIIHTKKENNKKFVKDDEIDFTELQGTVSFYKKKKKGKKVKKEM